MQSSNNNLTKLHEQFQRKHLQLSQITQKIDSFMQIYGYTAKNKAVSSNHPTQIETEAQKNVNAKQRIKQLRDVLINMKNQFGVLKEDLITYGCLPNQFIRMVVELPAIYENFWDNLYSDINRKLQIKQQQCKLLRQKLNAKDVQILQLKYKIHQKQQKQQLGLTQNLSSISLHNTGKFEPHREEETRIQRLQVKTQPIIKPQDHQKNMSLNLQINQNYIKQTARNSNQNQEQTQDLDDYIDKMEITIRESDDPLFKKITQQFSQEQQQEQEEDSTQFEHNRSKRNNTARVRPNIILDSLDESNQNQLFKYEQPRKNSQSSCMRQINPKSVVKAATNSKPDQLLNKHVFWNKLTKTMRQSNSKSKISKSLSQSKQNIDNRDLNLNLNFNLNSNSNSNANGNINMIKFSAADKKILTSKITDFRRMLFVQKGIQRMTFKI